MGRRPDISANRQRGGHRLRQYAHDKKRCFLVVAYHARDAAGAFQAGGRRDWRLRLCRVDEEHRHRADRNRYERRSENLDAQRHARGQLDMLVLRVIRRVAVADRIPYPTATLLRYMEVRASRLTSTYSALDAHAHSIGASASRLPHFGSRIYVSRRSCGQLTTSTCRGA